MNDLRVPASLGPVARGGRGCATLIARGQSSSDQRGANGSPVIGDEMRDMVTQHGFLVSQKRAEDRDSIFFAGVLTRCATGAKCKIKIRNLSASGLMAEGVGDISSSVQVSVALRGIGCVMGEVVWSDHDRAGIKFHAAIDPLRARRNVGRLSSRHGRHAP